MVEMQYWACINKMMMGYIICASIEKAINSFSAFPVRKKKEREDDYYYWSK